MFAGVGEIVVGRQSSFPHRRKRSGVEAQRVTVVVQPNGVLQ